MQRELRKNLFFNNNGDAIFGRVQPAAYSWNYPWPPSATNLNKNKVYRPSSVERAQHLKLVRQQLAREAKYQSKMKDDPREATRGRTRLVPDIELAIYWDRNPYRQRILSANSLDKLRSKSAANISSLNELLCETIPNEDNNSEISQRRISHRNSVGSQSTKSSSSNNSNNSNNNNEQQEVHKEGCPAAKNSRHLSTSDKVTADEEVSALTAVMVNAKDKATKERSKKGDNESTIENKSGHKSRRQSAGNGELTGNSRIRRDSDTAKMFQHRRDSFEEEFNPEAEGVRAVGVQVTSDAVSLAALKSIYFCPLHGQYSRKEKERRDKAKKQYDVNLTTAVHPDNMSCGRCSRHHSQSRSRTASSKTSSGGGKTNGGKSNGTCNNGDVKTGGKSKVERSKTAKSEYSENYRHPTKLSPSYNRQLRNKILSYCFNKNSIF